MTTALTSLGDIARQVPGYDPFATEGEYVFSEAKAQEAVDFFHELLHWVEGDHAGEPFELHPWMMSVVVNLYGWRKPNGRRRYKESLIYLPRKNLKTTFAAGLLAKEFFASEESGAQCFCGASDRDQASIVFRYLNGMINREEELSSRCQVYRSMRSIERTDGELAICRVLSSEGDRAHGLSPTFAILDELHVHRNADLVDAIRTGTAARPNYLIVYTTTADYQRESVCNRIYDYACKVRDGRVKDDTFLPVIYEAPKELDWRSPEAWRIANPNLGVSVTEEYIERACRKAQDEIGQENVFKRLHLNIRTEQVDRVIPMDAWDQCSGMVDAEALVGRPCFGGLDLSSERDITAFVLVFPEDDWQVLCWFWLPEDSAEERQKRDGVPYPDWLSQGYLQPTPGGYVDHQHVGDRILEAVEKYDIQTIAFDRARAAGVYGRMEAEGVEMAAVPQTHNRMCGPFTRLLAMIGDGRLRHGGHPVLRWMATNTASEEKQGQHAPVKSKSTEKIDGIVALTMAIAAAEAQVEQQWTYEEGELFL